MYTAADDDSKSKRVQTRTRPTREVSGTPRKGKPSIVDLAPSNGSHMRPTRHAPKRDLDSAKGEPASTTPTKGSSKSGAKQTNGASTTPERVRGTPSKGETTVNGTPVASRKPRTGGTSASATPTKLQSNKGSPLKGELHKDATSAGHEASAADAKAGARTVAHTGVGTPQRVNGSAKKGASTDRVDGQTPPAKRSRTATQTTEQSKEVDVHAADVTPRRLTRSSLRAMETEKQGVHVGSNGLDDGARRSPRLRAMKH